MAESQRPTRQEAQSQDTPPESREVLCRGHKQGSPSSEGNQRPQTPVPVHYPHPPARTGALAGIDSSSSRSVPESICGVTPNSGQIKLPRMTAHVWEVRL